MARRRREPEPVRYGTVQTPWGRLWVVASARGLVALSFRRQPAGQLVEGLARRVRVRLIRDAEGFRRYERALGAFLGGGEERLQLPLDLRGVSDFSRRVYDVTRRIPPGKTLSYGEVAERVGGRQYARAVGQALAANPIPVVIPCHRVIAAGGSLGGFSAGLPWKRRLLALERGQQVLAVR